MKYRLLKDLPWCSAGEIFERKDDKFTLPHAPDLYTSDIRNIDEWFEKVKELTINDIDWNFDPQTGDACYFTGGTGVVSCYTHDEIYGNADGAIGSRFRTKEEAEAYREWLKAVVELRRSSCFKPDWNDGNQLKYYVAYCEVDRMLNTTFSYTWNNGILVYYETDEDAKQSIKDHKGAWLTYFGVNK